MFRDLDDEIGKKEEELRNLREEKEEFEKLGEDKRLAEIMHDGMCHIDHTEGCSWSYESWVPIGATRSRFLHKARLLLQIVQYDVALTMLRILFRREE